MIKEVEREVEIGELFKELNISNPGTYIPPSSLEVETSFGWKKIKGLLKTQENPEWEIETVNNTKAIFTDLHKLETKDGIIDTKNNLKWSFVKDLKSGDEVNTKNGWENIKSVFFNGKHSEMFDMQVEDVACFYAGGFNSHNTLALGNLAINAYLAGKNVLVYSFETSEERLMMRYYSNIAHMTKKEIIASENTLIENYHSLESITDMGEFIVKEFPANTACANDLLAHCNDLKTYWNFVPDIIIADYILIMKTNDSTMSTENSYKYYKTVTEELRNLGKELYVPILTASQINREGMADRGGSKPNLTGKSVSESRGIHDTSDVFIPIMQTAADKAKNIMRIGFDKNRNDRTGDKIEFDVDYDYMKMTETALIS